MKCENPYKTQSQPSYFAKTHFSKISEKFVAGELHASLSAITSAQNKKIAKNKPTNPL